MGWQVDLKLDVQWGEGVAPIWTVADPRLEVSKIRPFFEDGINGVCTKWHLY